ncbi:MAG: ABC transporter ATP-binding protein [Verrucomicrobiota bacterium]
MSKSDEIMVDVQGVSKKFCRDLKTSYFYGMVDLGRELTVQDMHSKLRAKEFWALQNVSFQLKRGESLGIIGPNGSGKTTLLKLLYGIIRPNIGTITMKGRIAALIELNSGMNQLLTGRENIYIIGSVLGLTHAEIEEHIEEIIEFSELGKFVDSPVKNYSSGMKIRLGFSVATNLKPDVFIIDEVLAVGDMAFVRKCQQKMSEILDSGATVIFVSHAIRHVERLCQKTLFLHKSEVRALGPTPEVTQKYYQISNDKVQESLGDFDENKGEVIGQHVDKSLFEITKVELVDARGEVSKKFKILEQFTIRLHYKSENSIEGVEMGYSFNTLDGICLSWFSNNVDNVFNLSGGSGWIDCTVPAIQLREGVYTIACGLSDSRGKLFSSDRLYTFNITPDDYAYHQAGSSTGLVYTEANWSTGK